MISQHRHDDVSLPNVALQNGEERADRLITSEPLASADEIVSGFHGRLSVFRPSLHIKLEEIVQRNARRFVILEEELMERPLS